MEASDRLILRMYTDNTRASPTRLGGARVAHERDALGEGLSMYPESGRTRQRAEWLPGCPLHQYIRELVTPVEGVMPSARKLEEWVVDAVEDRQREGVYSPTDVTLRKTRLNEMVAGRGRRPSREQLVLLCEAIALRTTGDRNNCNSDELAAFYDDDDAGNDLRPPSAVASLLHAEHFSRQAMEWGSAAAAPEPGLAMAAAISGAESDTLRMHPQVFHRQLQQALSQLQESPILRQEFGGFETRESHLPTGFRVWGVIRYGERVGSFIGVEMNLWGATWVFCKDYASSFSAERRRRRLRDVLEMCHRSHQILSERTDLNATLMLDERSVAGRARKRLWSEQKAFLPEPHIFSGEFRLLSNETQYFKHWELEEAFLTRALGAWDLWQSPVD
jgi:hypothetical protein